MVPVRWRGAPDQRANTSAPSDAQLRADRGARHHGEGNPEGKLLVDRSDFVTTEAPWIYLPNRSQRFTDVRK